MGAAQREQINAVSPVCPQDGHVVESVCTSSPSVIVHHRTDGSFPDSFGLSRHLAFSEDLSHRHAVAGKYASPRVADPESRAIVGR